MRALVAVVALVLGACSPQPAVETGTVPELDGAFGFGSLQLIDDQGEPHDFDVYLATTPEQQRRGLMFVRQMPETTGMLFIYDEEDIHSMWMKNTYISLDIVFALSDGSISSVIQDAVLIVVFLFFNGDVPHLVELNRVLTNIGGIGVLLSG